MLRYSFVLLIVLAIIPNATGQSKVQKTDTFGDSLPTGALMRIGTTRYRLPDTTDLDNVRLSPDGKYLAALSSDGTIDIWALPNWIFCRSLKPIPAAKEESPRFRRLKFTADGKSLTAYDSANRLVVHDVTNGKCTHQIELPMEFRPSIGSVVISQDRQILVCSGYRKDGMHETLVWNLSSNALKHTICFPVSTELANPLPSPITSPTCRTLLLGTPPGGGVPALHSTSLDCRWLAIGNTKSKAGEKQNYFLEFWDCATGKLAHKIATESPVHWMVFSPDAAQLAVCLYEPTIRIYEVATGKEVHNVRQAYESFGLLVFAPDSKTFYVPEDRQSKISQWNAATGELMANYSSPVGYGVQQFAFTQTGKPLALAQVDRFVYYWEVHTEKLVSPTDVSRHAICAVHFSKQGELFIAGEDGQCSWWNPRAAAKTLDLKLEARKKIEHRPFWAMSVHGEFLVHSDRCGGGHTKAGISEFKTGKYLYDDETESPQTLSLFAKGQRVASLQCSTIRVWNTRTGRDLAKFDIPLKKNEKGAAMTVSENGHYFAVATEGGNGSQVLLWDSETRETRTVLDFWPIEHQHTTTLCFSPDNQWLVFTDMKNSLRLVRLGSALGVSNCRLGESESILCVAFSSDSRQLACATAHDGGKQSSRIVIYELASKKIRCELAGHATGLIGCLAYSHDGAMLASGASDTTALVWDTGFRSTVETNKNAPEIELQTSFAQLAGDDAQAAFQEMVRLAQAPRQTIALLTDKIPPAAKPNLEGRSISDWIADLGNGRYATRSKAAALLLAIGKGVQTDLRAALSLPKDLETKRRIQDLLARLAARDLTPQEIHHVRAVEVAEAIATTQARALLTRWSTGNPGAVLTQEAKLALQRIP